MEPLSADQTWNVRDPSAVATSALVITVGIPGSGKSTLAQELRVAGMINVAVSSDDIRAELTGDMTDQDRNREVFDLLYARVESGLAQEMNVLVDATNLRGNYRNKLKVIGDRYASALLVYRLIDSSDFELCQKRNLNRERVVPEFVMQRFHTMWLEHCSKAQLESEGWTVLEWPERG